VVVWSLIVLNVVSMAVGTWALARVAADLGASSWLGLAFVLNPGMLFEMSIDGSSVLGLALAIWAVERVGRGHWTAGALLFTGAVLARETLVLAAAGAFLYLWRRHGIARWDLIVIPAVAAGLWWLWVRVRLGPLNIDEVESSIVSPFRGLIAGMANWFATGGLNLALGALVAFCAVVVLWSALSNPSLLTWSVLGFVPLMLVLHSDVVRGALNMTRAVAPVLTVGMMLAASRKALRSRPETRPAPFG
jgi:hypothetical protein